MCLNNYIMEKDNTHGIPQRFHPRCEVFGRMNTLAHVIALAAKD